MASTDLSATKPDGIAWRLLSGVLTDVMIDKLLALKDIRPGSTEAWLLLEVYIAAGVRPIYMENMLLG